MTPFIHLHTHSQFSILHSTIQPKELFHRAKELEQPAVAITDHGTFAGVWDALKASRETGTKLIVGCEYYFLDDIKNRDQKFKYIVLLAKNQTGYKNLLLLNRYGFDTQFMMMKKVISVIDWKMLDRYKEGVICLTGCANGILGSLLNEKNFTEAENTIKRLQSMFGDDLGIEVQSHNSVRYGNTYFPPANQTFTNTHAIRLAKQYGVKIVPTSNVYYTSKDGAETNDVLLAIGSGQPTYSNNRIKFNSSDLYMKTGDEVKSFFARNNGEELAAEMCSNTLYFANKCETPDWIEPKYSNPGGKEYPIFACDKEDDYAGFLMWRKLQPEKVQKCALDAAFLRFRCEKVLEKKAPAKEIEKYKERLEEELDVLEFQKFSSYMLIVADYVFWARKNGISVGPGRGSVGGSLIAYLLDIHKADPLKYGLIFARFQNRERTAFPDVDQDFSTSGRERVIDYIKNKYGKDSVVGVSNFARLTPKVYARDIARSCDLANNRQESVILGNKAADAIPADNKNDINFDHLQALPLFGEFCKQYPDYTKHRTILGGMRNTSTHAAAILLGSRSFEGLVPLRKDKDGAISIEYEKDRSEENGLLKVDILGLSTLDLIDEVIALIKKSGKELSQDYINYDRYDKPTYDLITSGNTYGVFQLGISAGTIALCKQIKPKSIDDLALITTLARPAARDIREAFIATREGKKHFKLLHPSLKSAFADTFGFGLYDESILKLGQDVAGWSLNSADRIRKMIKEKGKNPEKTEKLRHEFIDGAVKNKGIEKNMAMRIWDEEIKKFGGYSFCQAHAVLYSLLSFTTAYLKAHYPIEFLLANLMSEVQSGAKVAAENIDKIKREIKAMDVKILPLNINTSTMTYELVGSNQLMTGFDALKFVGKEAIEDILAKRPFKSFDDFMLRTNAHFVRSNTIQALIATGCFDGFGLSRKVMFLYCSDYRKKLQVWLKKHDPNKETFQYPWPVEKEWDMSELYALEKKSLGEAFICGKAVAYGNGKFFNGKGAIAFRDAKEMLNRDQISSVVGEIKSIFELRVKKAGSKFLGQPMMKATIEDASGEQMSLTVFPDAWKRVQKRVKELGGKGKFEPGYAIHFSGSINVYDDETGLVLEDLYSICAPPKAPADLKAHKVVVKRLATKENMKEIKLEQTDEMIEDLEDGLFESGLIELDEEDDENGFFD